MQKKNILKWAVIALIVFFTVIIQETPHALPPIFGVLPAIAIPCVLSVAMIEGEAAGAGFAVLAGLMWDLGTGRVFGFNALFLLIYCVAASLLVQYLFSNTMVTAILFCAGFTFLHEFITWFFFSYLAGSTQYLAAFAQVIIPVTCYTMVIAIPYYLLFKFIKRRLTKVG